MTTNRVRRLTAAVATVLTAGAAWLAVPATEAAAAPSVRSQSVFSPLASSEVATDVGTAALDLYLGTARGELVVFADDRSVVARTGDDFAVTVTPDRVTARGTVADAASGAPLGTAEVALDLTRSGTHVVREHLGTGNDASRRTATISELHGTGVLTLLGRSYPLEAAGEEIRYELFSNAPASQVGFDEDAAVSAVVRADDGRVLALQAGGVDFSAVVIDAAGEVTTVAVGVEDVRTLTRDGLHGAMYVYDLATGADPVERTVDVDATIGREKVRTVEDRGAGPVTLTTQVLTLHGVLELAPGTAFDLDGVTGTWTQYRWAHRSTGG